MKARRWARWGKGGLLGLATAVIVLAAASDDGGEQPRQAGEGKPRAARAAQPRHAAERHAPIEIVHVELERLSRAPAQGEDEPEVANLFSPTSWYVPPPPPPPPPPAPPPKPTAPPMPFTYLGSYQETPTPVILLLKGERLYTVAEGEVIENTYLVGPVNAGQLEMTYLPLSIKQTIRTG